MGDPHFGWFIVEDPTKVDHFGGTPISGAPIDQFFRFVGSSVLGPVVYRSSTPTLG